MRKGKTMTSFLSLQKECMLIRSSCISLHYDYNKLSKCKMQNIITEFVNEADSEGVTTPFEYP